MSSRLAAMTAAFATANLARTAIAFLTSLVVARGLGVGGFGLWTLGTAWASVLTVLFDLGFGVLLTRDAARDDPAIGRLVATALIVRLGLLAPTAALFAVAAPWLGAAPEGAHALRMAALLAAAGVAYSSASVVFQVRQGPLAGVLALDTIGAAGQCAAAWWLVRRGTGVAGLLAMSAAAQTLQLAAILWMWRTADWLPPIERPRAAEMFAGVRRALPFAAAGLVANAQLRIAPLLLGAFSTGAALASFGVAFRLGSLVRLLPQAAFAGALPLLSRHVSGQGARDLRSRFEAALRRFAVAAAVGIALGAGPLVRVTYGDAFGGAVPALVWVALGLVPTIVNGGRKVLLNAAGHEGAALGWSAAALAMQTTACAALIPSFGATGAAAALAIGEAAVWLPLQRCVEALELPRRPVGIVSESPASG